MEAEQRESATSATAIADAEDIESQRYRPCCERPDDSMSCIARPASNRCRVATKSTRLAENATLLAALLARSPSLLALVRVVLVGLLRLLLALRQATLPAVALFLLPAAAPRLAAMFPSLLARVFRPVVR